MELNYQGNFHLPTLKGLSYAQYTFNFSQFPFAYRPKTNTLVIRGHQNFIDFAEVNIPAMGGTAAVIGNWFDITGGLLAKYTVTYPATKFFPRSLVIDNNDMAYGCISAWYDVNNTNYTTHFSTDLNTHVSKGLWGTNFHSLACGGYLCELSKTLKDYYKVRFGGGESIAQGLSGTNNGPSLYAYDINTNLPAGSNQTATNLVKYPITTPYPGYDGSWQFNAIHSLPDHVIWTGKRGVGNAWYGESDSSTGAHPTSVRYIDKCGNSKGYHNDNYQPTMWICDNDSIIAGKPKITEFNLAPYLKGTVCSYISSAIDLSGRLFVLERQADSDKPLIHVFSFRSQSMLESQITTLTQTIATLTQQVNDLTVAASAESAKNVAALTQQLADLTAAAQVAADKSAAQITVMQAKVDLIKVKLQDLIGIL